MNFTSQYEEELLYTMALMKVKGIGAENARALIAGVGSAKAVLKANLKDLLSIPGMGPKTAHNIRSFRNYAPLEEELSFIKKHKIEAFTFHHENYPKRLRELSDAPPLIFYKGSVSLNHPRVIGVVGTRRATEYGKSMCKELLQDMKTYDAITISGLAYGIDVECHKSSLELNIPTVASVAHGLDSIYPSAHTNLARKMVKNGGLMTEHFSGTEARKEFFPRRNRLVAGLVDALIVIESPEKGGSLITAEIAFSYNREVLAVPGRTKDEKSKGCNYLIKSQKAMLVESAQDVADCLGWPTPKRESAQQAKLAQLKGSEKRIYEYLRSCDGQKSTVELIAKTQEIDKSDLSLKLLNMEFEGYVKSLPGNFVKAE